MNEKKSIFSFEHAEDSSGFLLWQVTNLWQRKIKKALEIYDLTHSQYVLMASIHWLELHEKEVTQIVLSSHTKIDPMTTSTVLRTLEKKQYIMRKEHVTDTRAKNIQLTKKGSDIVKQAVVTVENFDRDFFSAIDNKKTFNAQLQKLIR
ncbi:MarR family transcriptional regulator [uncultured Chryseobacterium sp.]|uniref:MarR family winged helix-turn-helix transcriptional regulator n=1 Tax=uncultured Chryseobacterium sp. TaxID=259322 RepID=UPI0025EC3789|nr:MarR family transcriptional regulator [uncultured Chryseobacterium sp.]